MQVEEITIPIDQYWAKTSELAEKIGRLEYALEQAQKHNIQITDEDSFSMEYYALKVHKNGQADKVKATLALGSHFQLKALLRVLLESCDIDPKQDDLTCLNLAWLWED